MPVWLNITIRRSSVSPAHSESQSDWDSDVPTSTKGRTASKKAPGRRSNAKSKAKAGGRKASGRPPKKKEQNFF